MKKVFLGGAVCIAMLVTVHQILVGETMMNHLVNGSPIGQSTQIAVVDPQVGLELSGETMVVFLLFFGIVAIHGIEFQSPAPAKLDGLVEVLPFANGP